MLTKSDLIDALKPILKTLQNIEAEQEMISLRQRAQGMAIQTLQAEVAQHDQKMEKKLKNTL